MVRLKNIFATLFILLLLGISASYFVFVAYLKTQKKLFRAETLSQNHSALIKVEMPAHQLYKDLGNRQWKEKGRELVIDGVYHEVLKVVKSGSLVTVYLIEDKSENKLLRAYFNSHKFKPGSYSGILLHLILLLFLPSEFFSSFALRCFAQAFLRVKPALLPEVFSKAALKPPAC